MKGTCKKKEKKGFHRDAWCYTTGNLGSPKKEIPGKNEGIEMELTAMVLSRTDVRVSGGLGI
jgi:hypothetical protein